MDLKDYPTLLERLAGVEWTRHALAMTLGGGLVYGFVMGNIEAEVFVPLATMAIGFFFNSSGGRIL